MAPYLVLLRLAGRGLNSSWDTPRSLNAFSAYDRGHQAECFDMLHAYLNS